MKSEVSAIRTESGVHRSQINELNDKIDEILMRYIKNEIGFKEMKKQTYKISKLKDEVLEKVSRNIEALEQIENEIKNNYSDDLSSKIIKIK